MIKFLVIMNWDSTTDRKDVLFSYRCLLISFTSSINKYFLVIEKNLSFNFYFLHIFILSYLKKLISLHKII